MKILKYSLAIATTLILTGCTTMHKDNDKHSSSGMDMLSMMPMIGMMNMTNMNSKKNQPSSDSVNSTGQEHSKSYIITHKYCTQCHSMKEKDLHSVNEWKPTLKRMIDYMQNQGKLQPDEYEKVMIDHYYGIDS